MLEVRQERVKENRRRQSACTMLFPHVADNAWMLTKFKGWEKQGTYVSGSLALKRSTEAEAPGPSEVRRRESFIESKTLINQ